MAADPIEFEGSIMGLDQCFKCKGGKHSKLVMPEMLVIPETAQKVEKETLNIDQMEQARLLQEFERKQTEKILPRSNPETDLRRLDMSSSEAEQQQFQPGHSYMNISAVQTQHQEQEDRYVNASVAEGQYQEIQGCSYRNTSATQEHCQLSNQSLLQHGSIQRDEYLHGQHSGSSREYHEINQLDPTQSLTGVQNAEALSHYGNADTTSSGGVKSNLVKESRVQMAPSGPDESLMYGEIKWIGHVPGNESAVAGIELVRY